MHTLWVLLWIVVGLLGVACLVAGAYLEARQQRGHEGGWADLRLLVRYLLRRDQDRTTGERRGRTRTGE